MSTEQENKIPADYFKVMDPARISAKPGKGKYGPNACFRDNKDAMVTVLSPPLRVNYPRLFMEGGLGEGQYDKGLRPDAKFSMEMTVGAVGKRLSKEQKAVVIADQIAFFSFLYTVGRGILSGIYDLGTEAGNDFQKPIADARKAAMELEIAACRDGSLASYADVENALRKGGNPILEESMRKRGHEAFISRAAKMFPDPAEYDEEGMKVLLNGKRVGMKTNIYRKVWKYTKQGREVQNKKAIPPPLRLWSWRRCPRTGRALRPPWLPTGSTTPWSLRMVPAPWIDPRPR